jgi:integrase/recombinase XerD
MKTLRQAVQDYLALRRGLGFKLQEAGAGLLDFVAFLEREKASHITVELAVRWATAPSHRQPAAWASRLTWVRGFTRYWSATDPRTEIPPWGLLPHRPGRARPYLYTPGEIARLLEAAKALPPPHGLRGWTYSCLFGLLTVTGLRLSEALALTRQDVDLEQGVLTIRHGKFGKSRLVPLHSSTRHVLGQYAARRDGFLGGQTPPRFLVSDSGKPLEGSVVRRTFYQLSRQTGLRAAAAHQGPRLHDFRHRFAVETLVQWYRAELDVHRRLPLLSAYLGHAHVSDTYWYLSACPELLGLATERLERRWEVES